MAGHRVLCVGTHPESLLLGGCLTLAGHEVVLLETRPPGSKAAAWAAAVESAAFGDREVDADLEAEVERLGHETPDPGAPGAPSR